MKGCIIMNNQKPPQPPKKKLKTWQIVLIVIGVILVLGAIANAGDSPEDNRTSVASSVVSQKS